MQFAYMCNYVAKVCVHIQCPNTVPGGRQICVRLALQYGVTAPVTHGSWVTWVMGQELNGSLGSWVTLSDPFPALIIIVVVLTPVLNSHGMKILRYAMTKSKNQAGILLL